MPVPVAIAVEADPDAAVTGAAAVAVARTIVAFVAVADTLVPVSTVATNLTTSPSSIELSSGTGRVIAVVADVPVVTVVHVVEPPYTAPVDVATVIGAADAGATARTVAPSTEATRIDSFFIFVLFPLQLIWFICELISHTSLNHTKSTDLSQILLWPFSVNYHHGNCAIVQIINK